MSNPWSTLWNLCWKLLVTHRSKVGLLCCVGLLVALTPPHVRRVDGAVGAIGAIAAQPPTTPEAEQPWGIMPPTGNPSGNPTNPGNPASQQPMTRPTLAPSPADWVNYQQFRQVLERTRAMISDANATQLARRLKLDILDLTWEDTGRYQNSSVGPNISDMTIQVQQFNPRRRQYELSLMPVIRHPNFSDITADVPLERFYLRVGNERGAALQRVSLRDLLGNLRQYLHQPSSWRGTRRSLLADRDTHVLVSAQACFLPIPKGGKTEFNPVLFNYQSYAQNPAVLTILATREGSSITIIDNQRDGFNAGQTWGQRLFFNKNGQRASLTGQRASDFPMADTPNQTPPLTSAAAESSGMNMVMLIQVPLKQVPRPVPPPMSAAPMAPFAEGLSERGRANSNVEAAVIGHGRVEGPFTEIDQLAIERDPRFPVRVTVQFYKATSNGVVSAADLEQIRRQIDRVYADADFVGSLVTGGGETRPTNYDGPKQQPPGWWEDFWRRHESNTGQSRQEALEMLRRLRGPNWQPASPEELQRELDRLPR
jgi:hypothetical protein